MQQLTDSVNSEIHTPEKHERPCWVDQYIASIKTHHIPESEQTDQKTLRMCITLNCTTPLEIKFANIFESLAQKCEGYTAINGKNFQFDLNENDHNALLQFIVNDDFEQYMKQQGFNEPAPTSQNCSFDEF